MLKISRRGGKVTQKNYTKKIFMTQIIMMVWSLAYSQTSWSVKSSGLRKHHYAQSYWRRWNFSWAISNSKRCCYKGVALNMPENLENSVVATVLEKVSFHSSPKERQCQRMFKLPHHRTHLTREQSKAQNSPSQASTVCKPWTFRCSSWI